MKAMKLFFILFIVSVLELASCTTFELRDANRQLTDLYVAKKNAQINNEWGALGSAVSSMNILAGDAAKKAEEEKDNVKNQIALYRIAATAAWQAENGDVLTYADKGNALCEGENFRSAPRDCGMLLIIPYFASVDEITHKMNKLRVKIKETPSAQRNIFAQDAENIFNEYKSALASILNQRPAIAIEEVHPDFISALDHNTGELLCGRIGFDSISLISTAKGDVKKYKCERHNLNLQAFDAGLRKPSAECLNDTRKEIEDMKTQECR